MKLEISLLCAVSVIYLIYFGIIPILTYPEYFQFAAVVSLLAAVVIPLSGMLESEFMEGDDDDEQESYHVSSSIMVQGEN